MGALKNVCLFIGVVALTGCILHPKPIHVNLKIQGGATINGNQQGESLPLVVQAFLLSNVTAFVPLRLRSFRYGKPPEASDITDWDQCVIQDQGVCHLSLEGGSKSRWISMVALYRRPEGKTWRVIKRLPKSIPYLPYFLNGGVTAQAVTL